MPMQGTMSLQGLYQYDTTLLDGLKAAVPDGVDAENVADTLLLESAGLEILYSNPVFMKAAITVWANEKRDIWQKLYDTTLLEYNPLDNYDRYEEYTRNASANGSTGTNATETANGTSTTENANTSYDSDTLKTTGTAETSGNNETETISNTNSETSNEEIFSSHIRGNIGVTSSMELIERQRKVVQFCLTEFICNEFLDKFTVGVY